MVVDRVKYGPIEAAIDSVQRSNTWLSMSLREGKNREIRRVMQALELPVTRLIRVAYGPFQLGTLPRGAVEEVNGKVLREQVPGLAK
ncbi:MAG: pseudouridine synthase, partial [Proteobacteria bacterium]|nr:pseudouridine synthase [Pseudomonadota bacterium]